MENLTEKEVDEAVAARKRALWIVRHMNELHRRYAALRALLEAAAAGADVDPLDIELANADLLAMLSTGEPQADEAAE